MDTYEVKPTPIIGLWELASLTPQTLNIHKPKYSHFINIRHPDFRLRQLLKFLGPKIKLDLRKLCPDHSYHDPSHAVNPKTDWHMDYGYGTSAKFNASNLLLVVSDDPLAGTVFRQERIIYTGKPWTVYLSLLNILHKTPEYITKTSHPDRILLRYPVLFTTGFRLNGQPWINWDN